MLSVLSIQENLIFSLVSAGFRAKLKYKLHYGVLHVKISLPFMFFWARSSQFKTVKKKLIRHKEYLLCFMKRSTHYDFMYSLLNLASRDCYILFMHNKTISLSAVFDNQWATYCKESCCEAWESFIFVLHSLNVTRHHHWVSFNCENAQKLITTENNRSIVVCQVFSPSEKTKNGRRLRDRSLIV